MKNMMFYDLELIHNALIEVEKVVFEVNKKLIESHNYSDMQLISKLKIKLDEIENIIIDAGKDIKQKEQYFKVRDIIHLYLKNNDVTIMYINFNQEEHKETLQFVKGENGWEKALEELGGFSCKSSRIDSVLEIDII